MTEKQHSFVLLEHLQVLCPASLIPLLLHPSEGNISSRAADADKSVQVHNRPICGSGVKSDYSPF